MSLSTNSAGSMLSVTKKVELNLTPSEVWQIIHDFGRMDWYPMVAKTQIIQGVSNVVGAVRKLTFLDGKTLNEQLTAYELDRMSMRYKITVGALPFSNYSSTLSVSSIGDGSKSAVIWSGTFSRADPSDRDSPGKDDKAALEAVTDIYVTGLKSLEEIAIDTLAIKVVIGYYSEGGTAGNREVVAKAFDPTATMKFIEDGVLVDEPIALYLKNRIKAGIKVERSVYIDYIDVKGTAASVRLTIDYATHQFIDYFNLLKIKGRWLIVSKIFHRVPKQQTSSG